jgi:hypothetical protein
MSIMDKLHINEKPNPSNGCDSKTFDLKSHLKSFERQNPEMTDEEAKYRLLFELGRD